MFFLETDMEVYALATPRCICLKSNQQSVPILTFLILAVQIASQQQREENQA